MRAGLVAGSVVAALVLGGSALAATRAGEALSGTTIDGVDVSGQDRLQVTAAVEELARERTAGTLPVTAADVSADVPRDLVTVDVDVTVDRAMAESRQPVGLLLGRGEPVAAAVSVDRTAVQQQLSALARRVDRVPYPGSIALTGTQVVAQPPVAGRVLEQERAAELVVAALEGDDRGPVDLPVAVVPPVATPAQVEAVATQARAALAGPYVLGSGDTTLSVTPEQLAPLLRSEPVDDVPVLRLDEAGLRAVVAQRAPALAVTPRSAAFQVQSSAPLVEAKGDLSWSPQPAAVSIRPSTPGRELDVDAATETLSRLVLAGDRTTPTPLPLRVVQPPLTTEQAQAARVRTLIGTFTTRFQAGQPRATNIRRIAELVDGAYVPPGEVLSLNDTAGRRTRANGFVADGAIVDGELTDEVGGGVSQFATTLFNAAFFAGLPILEHKPHSFYISRYPAGRESTVYFGAIDVKVRNDTSAGMLVRTRSTPSSVTVELYGDNGGRRVTSTTGPRRPRADGGFRIDVTRTITGGDGRGGSRVFSTSYDPVPPD